MNNFIDVLEDCISAINQGQSLEVILAEHPDFIDELKPILRTAIETRKLGTEIEIPTETLRRRREFLLKQATKMRMAIPASRKINLQGYLRIASSTALTLILLLTGTGVARAAATSLPGDHLYPVKRNIENIRLFITIDPIQKLALAGEIDRERLDEISELLARGRATEISFTGVAREFGDTLYVAGIHVLVTDTTKLPENPDLEGKGVHVDGWTKESGLIVANSIEWLPDGVIAPLGDPIENMEDSMKTERGIQPQHGNEIDVQGESSSSETEGRYREFKLEGTLESIQEDLWVVDGTSVSVSKAEISGTLRIGAKVELEGYFDSDGTFIVVRAEIENIESENRDPGFDSDEETDVERSEEGDDGDGESGGEDGEEENRGTNGSDGEDD